MLPPICTAFIMLYLVSHPTLAAPKISRREYVPLHRRPFADRTVSNLGDWVKAQRKTLAVKYGATGGPNKRSTGTNLILDQSRDTSYIGSLAIGTPPVSYNVILDTGSADLWIADAGCTRSCTNVTTFDPAKSSTFMTDRAPFSITYGSGQASGFIGADTVQMAGFSVINQTFGVCDDISEGLLTNPVSGLLGLAFGTIASSRSTPFWQMLVENGAWDSPVMAFHLTRHIDDRTAQPLEFGGSFTMGFVNDSLYTGEIEYIDLIGPGSYWTLPITSLTTQGALTDLPTGHNAYSAIDTGTTLLGGPSLYMQAFYSQIPGSAKATGKFEGYYTYPCNNIINATISFGGRNWPISEVDFRLAQLTEQTCLGAFFDLSTGDSAPSWIIGDVFLKNVYSVFRYDPPSVGFAQLSNTALALNDANTPLPSATIGSPAATATAAGLPSSGFSVHSEAHTSWLSFALGYTIVLGAMLF